MKWYPSANLDAQMAHIGWGAFIVLASSLAWGPLAAWLILAGWIGVKEWVFDMVVEQDSVSGSLMDSSFYVVGGVIGTLTWWLIAVSSLEERLHL